MAFVAPVARSHLVHDVRFFGGFDHPCFGIRLAPKAPLRVVGREPQVRAPRSMKAPPRSRARLRRSLVCDGKYDCGD
ncbi:MAG: hypothetical protein BGO98_28605 [Myxococcales bacterium 68-20]|nr:MAG: hypothetical protein BGO98_28605 [Myxococcales bacterium 68-20]